MNFDLLPEDARIKLESLQTRRDRRKAETESIQFRIRDCQGRCAGLSTLIRSAGTDAARAEFERKLEAARAEHERLVRQRNQNDAEMRSAANDVNRAEDFVLRQRAGSLRVVPRRPTPYSAEKLVQVRADIAKLQAELQRVESCPLDRESQKANRAKQFDEVLAGFLLEEAPYRTKLCTRTGTLRELTAFEHLWWAFPEKRDEWLNRLVPEAPDGMTAEAKAEARERVGARLLSAERAEEAVIHAGEQARTSIDRRPDADPRAVLGVTVVAAIEAIAA